MMYKRLFFPWRLFYKFFGEQLLVFNFTFILTVALGSYLIDFKFFELRILAIVILFGVLSTISTFFLSYRFALPFRRVILKTLRIASKKQYRTYLEKPEDEDLFTDEPGEFEELEVALEKIRRKLKKRRDDLAHEREEAQVLMSHLEEAVVSVDLNFNIQYYNSKFATLFRASDSHIHSEPGNSKPKPLTLFMRVPEILDMFKKSLEQKQSIKKNVEIISQLDQQKRFFSLVVSPLREERTREVYGVLALFYDITDVKKVEQIRMEFVENASHELRTPLTSIKGYMETIKSDIATQSYESVTPFLGIVTKNVDRLSELVTDMLELASLDAVQSVQKTDVLCQSLTYDVLERLSRESREKDIVIQVKNEAEMVRGDDLKVELVLQNLVSNAIKYTPRGSRVDIQWKAEDNGVLLIVKDNGPGIAIEFQDRLFERFYRVEKSRSREVGGTGLGLAIVKHIMQNHGGWVRIHSQLGQGAEFHCYFPD